MTKRSRIHSLKSAIPLIGILILIISVAEGLIMYLLKDLFTLSNLAQIIIDPVVLTLVISPFFYFLFYRPFQYKIEQQKRTNEELSLYIKELSDYKYALDKASIVAITDTEGKITFVNDNFCKITKYSANELIGQDHRIIKAGYHPKEFILNLWETIQAGKIWRNEVKNKAKDGTFFWLDTAIVPFLDKQGKPVKFLTIRTDITVKKESELALAKLNDELEQKVEERTRQLQEEKMKSDELLLNILPLEIADEIKKQGKSQPKTYSMVTVMFTDFKDFTEVSEKVSAELLVSEIDYCFSAFDNIIHKHTLEKIKTVGDAYLCAGGMPVLTFTHAVDTVRAAIEIRNFMLDRKKEKEARGEIPFEIRIGIHTGSVVAGVVGVKKFAYDIWGDTVNLAARMEQNSEEGKINISGSTYELVKEKFSCTHRGKIQAKNKGEIDMYYAEAVS